MKLWYAKLNNVRVIIYGNWPFWKSLAISGEGREAGNSLKFASGIMYSKRQR